MADTREIQKLIRTLEKIQRNAEAAKDIVDTVHAKVTERIFRQSGGSDINGANIGRYTDSYRKTRIRKGLTNTRNVNLTFTGNLREMFDVIPLPSKKGVFRWGSGWNNPNLYDLSIWLEKKYNKKDKIFALSEQEEKLFYNLNEKYIQNAID